MHLTHLRLPVLEAGRRFHLDSGAEVREALQRVRADGVEIIEHDDDSDGVSFRCVDPDGRRIEVYWEA
jgi:catechol 2,3-dioxygenase-like lactoylglutathione lyase family enzyme